MLSISDIKLGTVINHKGQPYLVIYTQHVKMGRGGANLKTKLRNLMTGQNLEITYSGSDKAEEADLEYNKASYLYRDGTDFYFMSNDTYEQFSLPYDAIGEPADFLKEGTNVDIMMFDGRPVAARLPIKVDLIVVESPPGIKGDTAGSAYKVITLETGKQIKAPLFIKEGELIRINTETGEYVERVSQ